MNQQAISRSSRAARSAPRAPASTRPPSSCAASKSDVPDDFVALLFGRAAPEDLVGYEAAELAALAREAWAFLATRKPGAPKIRFEPPHGVRRRASQVDLGDRDRQRRHAVPGRFGDGRIDRARPRRPPGRPSDPRGRARRKTGKLTAPPAEAGSSEGRDARELHPRPRRAHRRRRSAAPRSCRRWSRCWPRSGSACRTGGRWSAASTRSIAGAQGQSAAGAGRRHRRGDPVPGMAGRRQLHLARRARLRARPARSAISSRCWRAGSACCAAATCRC